MRLWVRRIGAVLLAAAAIAVWFGMAPGDAPEAKNRSALISQALDDAETNESTADTAPQQQVVNGWVARDLLAVIAMQQTDQASQRAALDSESRDERPAALLVLLVLGAAIALVTSESATAPTVVPTRED